MESRHCGQDKRIFFCPVHNASTPCSLQAFGISRLLVVLIDSIPGPLCEDSNVDLRKGFPFIKIMKRVQAFLQTDTTEDIFSWRTSAYNWLVSVDLRAELSARMIY